MIRLLAALLLAAAFPAFGKTLPACHCVAGQVKKGCFCPQSPPDGPPRLAGCSLPAFTPSEAQPFDLDACTINEGDDVTALLTDIRAMWPAGFYVRAPSKTVSVVSDTIKWPSVTKTYVFLADENPANRLTVQHKANPSDFWTLWGFENFDTVKIGAITLRGNHPGLANCDVQKPVMILAGYDEGTAAICDANKGLVEFRMSDGSLATLADVRADIKFSQAYSIYTWGSVEEGGVTDKIQQFNVSGLHYATSGVFFHQGVKNAWSDPAGFVVSDPYVRGIGWTGVATTQMQGGLPLGCNDQTKDQVRFSAFAGYYTDSITGGVTIEYGAANWVQRYTGRIGTSAADPYVVRIKDWYVSGPGTGYPAGVRVKKSVEATFFKGEPNDRFDGTVRFVRFEKLPDTYGSGPGSDYLDGCLPSNAYFDADSMFSRLENNTQRLNKGWDITFTGDWTTNFIRSDLFVCMLPYNGATVTINGVIGACQ